MIIDFAGEANTTEGQVAQLLEHKVIQLEWFPHGTGVIEKKDVYIDEGHANHWVVRDWDDDQEEHGEPYKVLYQLVHRVFLY